MKKTAIQLRRAAEDFLHDEEGSQVLEVVVVIAVVLAVAVIFNAQLRDFADRLFRSVFADNNVFTILQ